jgi:hypothetical protein
MGGDLYALQGLVFEQQEDLGPIIANAITSTGNTPDFALPAVDMKKPLPQSEPLAIPSAPVQVSFSGTYQSMLNFLRSLANCERLLSVGDSFEMTVADSPSGSKRLKVALSLQEFTFARGTEGKFAPTPVGGPPAPAPTMVGPAGAGPGGMTKPGPGAGQGVQEATAHEQRMSKKQARMGGEE